MTVNTDHPDTATQPGPDQPVEPVRVEPDPDRIQHLDPRTLITNRNVRSDAAADARLVSSVRDHGVLQPITAVATGDGRARVRFGHRRVQAALAAEAATVPVIVCGVDDATDEAEAERIASQYVENETRRGLAVCDQLVAFADLAALGKSPGQIAKLTKARRRDAVDALKAAESAEARDAVAAADLTLEQGATLAEFADDPEGYGALLDSATGGGRSWESFAHLAARLREDRAEQAQRAAALAELAAAGVVVVSAPGYNDPVTDLDDLTNDPAPADAPDGDSTTAERPAPAPIAAAEHADCPGHAAYLRRDYRSGVRPAPIVPAWCCVDPLTHGHRPRHSHMRLTTPSAPPKREGETTEQAAARETATKDAATAQRRRVLAGNRAWRAAETVRRGYLQTLLARKTPPKGAGLYLAGTLTLDTFAITKAAEQGHELAARLLTGHEDLLNRDRIVKLTDGVTDPRGQVIALGLILAGIEASTGVHSWRHADDRHQGDWRGEHPALGRYLRFLAATGYPLAPIERFAIGEDVDEDAVFTPPVTDDGPEIAEGDPDDETTDEEVPDEGE